MNIIEKGYIGLAFFIFIMYTVFIVLILGGIFFYTDAQTIWKSMTSETTLFAIKLTLITTVITTCLAIIAAVPTAYCLSHYEFRGKQIIDTLIDLPIVLPPLVVGLCILVFFSTPPGKFIEDNILKFVFSVPGIVLAQFSISASFAVITIKEAFDNLDPRYEQAARIHGCNKFQAFGKVILPLIKTGIIAGAVLTWTRAVGEFVPILLVCGAQRAKTAIMPIAIFLEFEVGNIEGAVGLTILFLLLSSIYLVVFKNFLLKKIVRV